jgi:hypothetical protein
MKIDQRPRSRRRWAGTLLASLPLCIAVAAAAPSVQERAADPCDLLTAMHLQQILGQAFEVPERSVAPAAFPGERAGAQCNYRMTSDHARQVVFIEYIDASAADAKAAFDKLSTWFPPTSQPFGVGDSAYIDDNRAIHVLKGRIRYYINIIPFGSVSPEKQKQLRDLADWVAGQL